jgi:hypothetical protein
VVALEFSSVFESQEGTQIMVAYTDQIQVTQTSSKFFGFIEQMNFVRVYVFYLLVYCFMGKRGKLNTV